MKKKFFILLFLSLMVVGCKSAQPITTVTDTVYKTVYDVKYKTIHDSVFIDRYHTQYLQGDTVFYKDSIYVYMWKFKYDTINKHDTTYISNNNVKTQIIEKKVNRWWPVWLLLFLEIIGICSYFYVNKKYLKY